jgi:hypothetical protein
MFNLELRPNEILHLGRILIEAATEHDNDEATLLFHQLCNLLEKDA